MSTEIDKNVTKTFKYSFPTCSNEEVLFHLEVPVEIPYDGSTRELVQRVINMFKIPVYLEDGWLFFSLILLTKLYLECGCSFIVIK